MDRDVTIAITVKFLWIEDIIITPPSHNTPTPTHTHTHPHSHPTHTHTAVVIGFVADSYDVNEVDGSVTMTLSILDGELEEGVDISVNFFTQDGSAIGK